MNIVSVIMAGGRGERLFPLTLHHSKPAVSYGGRYKLIDIPISNSLNSNIRRIFFIGQYLTAELSQHLAQTYHFDPFFPGMLDFLTPEEQPNGEKLWFDGTADAVRKNLDKILKTPVDYILILSGDQLYNIDFQRMLQFTIEKKADLTIATIPVNEHDAQRMGIMKTNSNGMVTDFVEKPQDVGEIKSFQLTDPFFKKWKLKPKVSPHYLGSMGIYIFKREALVSLLDRDPREDFGKHLIPTEMQRGKTAAFVYDGYWEDIGTIKSFYEANMMLTTPSRQRLQMHDEKNPIYTQENHLPGTKILGTKVTNSIICEGSKIEADELKNCIIGLRTNIKKGTVIRDSLMMGNQFYLPPAHQTPYLPEAFEIGQNCLIEKAIIDEHVFIGNNVQLINKEKLTTYDGPGVYVRDGIIIVTSGTRIPDGYQF